MFTLRKILIISILSVTSLVGCVVTQDYISDEPYYYYPEDYNGPYEYNYGPYDYTGYPTHYYDQPLEYTFYYNYNESHNYHRYFHKHH